MTLRYAKGIFQHGPDGSYEFEQRIYTDTAKFFYDPLGGDRIGGIWDPSLTKPMPFRVLSRFSSTPALQVCLETSLREISNSDAFPNNRKRKKAKAVTMCSLTKARCWASGTGSSRSGTRVGIVD